MTQGFMRGYFMAILKESWNRSAIVASGRLAGRDVDRPEGHGQPAKGVSLDTTINSKKPASFAQSPRICVYSELWGA